MNRETTKALIKLAGGPAKIGKALGITTQAVSQWDEVPDGQVLSVSSSCGYVVTPHQFRPDLYPHPDDGLPDHLRVRGSAVA